MSRNDPPGFDRFSGGWQKAPKNTVQGLNMHLSYGQRLEINEKILQIAEAEYERQYPPDQTIDEIRSRGGLSIAEVIVFLAAAVTRYAPPDALRPTTLSEPPLQ